MSLSLKMPTVGSWRGCSSTPASARSVCSEHGRTLSDPRREAPADRSPAKPLHQHRPGCSFLPSEVCKRRDRSELSGSVSSGALRSSGRSCTFPLTGPTKPPGVQVRTGVRAGHPRVELPLQTVPRRARVDACPGPPVPRPFCRWRL